MCISGRHLKCIVSSCFCTIINTYENNVILDGIYTFLKDTTGKKWYGCCFMLTEYGMSHCRMLHVTLMEMRLYTQSSYSRALIYSLQGFIPLLYNNFLYQQYQVTTKLLVISDSKIECYVLRCKARTKKHSYT